MSLLPASLARALDGASRRERLLVTVGALVVILAVLYAVLWLPMLRDVERSREALARDRATLAALELLTTAQTPASGIPATNRAPTNVDPRAAVVAALDARGLRTAATQLDVRDARVFVVLEALPFDVLVRLVDELARTAQLRVLEARVLARVEPGTVRAELTLGR